ncbi:uncharacterized protein KY384_004069 [Bacidia gigantensis]|uniref:uncharacterized protein n=1 Tax=Bacidia gigantensis TaxID=2732470 RepID=UPI001D051FF3|nr:uncharacterized protein KY384_004069 [Bacidia gigantensis]KAG8530712.1 hypothetical protein KY384_004069 [Bacidia gigantensis]
MATSRYIVYLTDWNHIIPEASLVASVTHVALAFTKSATFNQEEPTEWPLKKTATDEVRQKFSPGTLILLAIGGWGDTEGFDAAAGSHDGRKRFAQNVQGMVEATGADGVDIDWEYPGGNGEDYKKIPNIEKAWEIEAFPLLLTEIRAVLGPSKVISAAVPGLRRDMLAFTQTTIPAIDASLDFFNVMTYDLMNRRDQVTLHHTGIESSLDSINAYEEMGVSLEKLNLGFAFYIKWFKGDPNGDCNEKPIGCKAALMEDPETGDDLGQTGAFTWHDPVPAQLSASYDRAMKYGMYDSKGGGHYYLDLGDHIWWTWDTPDVISRKFPAIMRSKRLGGAFAWALGEDADRFVHLEALNAEMAIVQRRLSGLG